MSESTTAEVCPRWCPRCGAEKLLYYAVNRIVEFECGTELDVKTDDYTESNVCQIRYLTALLAERDAEVERLRALLEDCYPWIKGYKSQLLRQQIRGLMTTTPAPKGEA